MDKPSKPAESPVIRMLPSQRELVEGARAVFREVLHRELAKTPAQIDADDSWKAPELRAMELKGKSGEAVAAEYAIALTDVLLDKGEVRTWDVSRSLEKKDGQIAMHRFYQACNKVHGVLQLNSLGDLAALVPNPPFEVPTKVVN